VWGGGCAVCDAQAAANHFLSCFFCCCRVVDVQYVIANDGTDHTLAQLTLSFSDDTSPLKVRCWGLLWMHNRLLLGCDVHFSHFLYSQPVS